MKKLTFCLALVLAFVLILFPGVGKAQMGPGMMVPGGCEDWNYCPYCGSSTGPGVMGQGLRQRLCGMMHPRCGMGPGMMGRGCRMGPGMMHRGMMEPGEDSSWGPGNCPYYGPAGCCRMRSGMMHRGGNRAHDPK